MRQSKWINCETTAAPKEIVESNDSHSYGPMFLAYYRGSVLTCRWWQVTDDPETSNFLVEPGGYAIFPTHWMPLPEQPEESGD